jgi:hypothetical protein
MEFMSKGYDKICFRFMKKTFDVRDNSLLE